MSIAQESLFHRIHPAQEPIPGARPAVLLHGLMGFAANWGKVWPALEKKRPVLVLDQRGHGRSEKPLTGYDPTDYAKDLNQLLKFLGWKQAHIIGHSMGGRVALRFASLFPEQTASLVMEDSGVEARPDRIQWIQKLLSSVPTPFPNREAAKKFFQSHFLDDPLTGSFLHANLSTNEHGEMDWRFYLPGMIETIERGRATDARAEFTSIKVPTLLIRGEKSKEFPQEEADSMAKQGNVSLFVIGGAGHYVHAEKPNEFNEALCTFLDKVDGV